MNAQTVKNQLSFTAQVAVLAVSLAGLSLVASADQAGTKVYFWPALAGQGTAQPNLKALIRSAISGAKAEVLVVAKEITESDIADDLAAAKGRGVKVLCVMDAAQETNSSTQGVYLVKRGVTVISDNLTGTQGVTSIVIDQSLVITGSPTLTTDNLARDGASLFFITDPATVQGFSAYFWARANNTDNTAFGYRGKTAVKRLG